MSHARTLDRDRLKSDIDGLAEKLRSIATRIHENPEVCYQEHKAVEWLTEALAPASVQVERNLAGVATAFRARVGDGTNPRVAIIAEYDALPELGHACGHNLIAAGALGAFLGLAEQRRALRGTVELIGAPAEEGGGGKIKLLHGGVFEGVDAAMMYHPFDRDLLAHTTLASLWVNIRFYGAASHAALAPWAGHSALTACLQTFHLIDSQRIHFHDGVRVHGIVKNGGAAPNIIPENAEAEFSVRARDTEELARVYSIVERCARGAAQAAGVEVDVNIKQGYRELVNNMTMARRFGEHLESLGRTAAVTDATVGSGSTDMGDISHVVPSIHPWLAICEPNESTCHQRTFTAFAASDQGANAMLIAAKAMALTTVDLLDNVRLMMDVRKEFDQEIHDREHT